MEKYDGWVIKSFYNNKPFLMTWLFHSKKTDVIKDYEEITGIKWREERRRGGLKLVKVKIVEVMEES